MTCELPTDYQKKIDFNFEDGFELVIEARSVKTPDEIELFRESGVKADTKLTD